MSNLFTAIEQRDLAALQKLARSAKRLIEPNDKGEEPLPRAARLGWTEGVQALLNAGADPNRSDKDQSGFDRLGRSPLAETLSKGHGETARALIDAGAHIINQDRSLLWAFSFFGRKEGWGKALDLFEPLEKKGFNPTASGIGSEWLFVGGSLSHGLKTDGDQDRMEAWLNAKVGNPAASRDKGDCAWHLIFGSASQEWCPSHIAYRLSLSHEPVRNPNSKKESRGVMALEWGLEHGNEALTLAAATALNELGQPFEATAAFLKAAQSRASHERCGNREFALRQARCFKVAHEMCFSETRPLTKERIQAIGVAAYESGQAGLALGALNAGMEPKEIMKVRRGLSYYSKSDFAHPSRELCALFAAAEILDKAGEDQARSFWSAYEPDFLSQMGALSTDHEAVNKRMAQTEKALLERLTSEPQAERGSPVKIRI